jgi:hypothetical protein
MDDFHLLEDGGSIIGDDNFTLSILDLALDRELTILSIPRGPRLVLTTSATAIMLFTILTFSCHNVVTSGVSLLLTGS